MLGATLFCRTLYIVRPYWIVRPIVKHFFTYRLLCVCSHPIHSLCPRTLGGALSDDAVWRLSVCLSRTSGLSREQPRKAKIGTEVAYVTRDADTTFKVKRSRSQGGEGILWRPPAYSLLVSEIDFLLISYSQQHVFVRQQPWLSGQCADCLPANLGSSSSGHIYHHHHHHHHLFVHKNAVYKMTMCNWRTGHARLGKSS